MSWARIGDSDVYWASDAGAIGKLEIHTENGEEVADIVPIRQRSDGRGYLCVDVFLDGRKRTCKSHKLVMLAFMGPTPSGYHIDHFDHDKTNNRLSNLRFREASENSADCHRGSSSSKRLNERQKEAALLLFGEGWQTKAVSDAIQASESTVRRLKKELLSD